MINRNQKQIKPFSGLNRAVLGAIATTLGAGIFTQAALADPLADPQMPPVFCFRFTDIKAVEDDPEGDKFQVSFEVLNWTDRPVGGVRMALNAATITGDGIAASLAGAGIDNNGRPLGSGADVLPGNQLNSNTGKVVQSTNTAIQWDASLFDFATFSSKPIPNRNILAPRNTHDRCALVPGCQMVGGSRRFGTGTPTVSDWETVDNGNNVLDGFVMTIDDFDELEAISFNWNLLDVNGNAIGTPGVGNPMGFGTVNLTRLNINKNGDPDATLENQNILFPENTGFRQTANVFAKDSYRVTQYSDGVYDTMIPPGGSAAPASSAFTAPLASDVASSDAEESVIAMFAGEFGAGIVAPFVNPTDNIFDSAINTQPVDIGGGDIGGGDIGGGDIGGGDIGGGNTGGGNTGGGDIGGGDNFGGGDIGGGDIGGGGIGGGDIGGGDIGGGDIGGGDIGGGDIGGGGNTGGGDIGGGDIGGGDIGGGDIGGGGNTGGGDIGGGDNSGGGDIGGIGDGDFNPEDVPEPGTLIALGLAGLSMFGFKRRR